LFISVCSAKPAPLHLSADKARIAGKYIVVFKETTTAGHFASFLADLKTTHNVFLDHIYEHVFYGFAASLDKDQLMLVRTHPQVDYVEEDQLAHLNQGDCSETMEADWGLCRVSRRNIDLDGEYFYPQNAGRVVDAYIIDTGIYTQHQDFQGRAKFGFKSDNNWPSNDDNGHGTHVASTVGGLKYGVAKHVNLIAVKVLDAGGSGSYAGVIAGVNYCASERAKTGKPSVGNMSLGGGYSAALNQAVDKCSQAGVFLSVAAGNENQDACNVSPASATDVITVGATDLGSQPNGDSVDVRSYFSNYGDCVSVFAPGSSILGAWIGSPTATRTISGTSMASPHICGISAVFLDQNPSMDFDDIKAKVVDSATVGKIQLQCGNAACNRSPNLLGFNGCE